MRNVKSSFLPVVAVLAVAWLLPIGSTLNAQSAGGQLEGAISDESGARLPGVTVTAVNEAAGFDRVTVTDAQGIYQFPLLPTGLYRVTAQLEGFTTVTVKDVRIRVASTRELDFTLKVAPVEELITVADSAPVIRTSPSIGTVVSQEELERLPLNGRQFAALGSLAPGTTLGTNPDPTKVGKLVVALNGGSGRNVNFQIDGGDNTDDTIGGQLQNFSLESVEEFNFQTQQFKAEYGRTTGGVLSVVTKSGGNAFDGSIFAFRRDDSLNSKTTTEEMTGADKQPLERDQFGFSLGGPIIRDRAHFFVTGERFDQETTYTVSTGGILPGFDGQSFPIPTKDDLITAKVTADVTPKQYLQVRYGFQETETKYGATPTVTPDALGDLTNEFETILFGLNSLIGTDTLNELRIQHGTFDNMIVAASNNPTIYFPSGVQTGQNPNTPQATSQEKLQIKDDFSFSTTLWGQRHDFKVGVEYIDEPTLEGSFSSGLNGLFTALEDRPDSPITNITFFSGSFEFATPNEQYRVYFQDDWTVNDRLTLNLGIRYEYTDILELDQRSNPIWQALSTQTAFNEPYLQDFQGGRGGVIDADDDDFAPRVGFTWDPAGDGKSLVRGGWGIFYDFPYSNATVLFPSAAVQAMFGVSYSFTAPNGIRNPDGTFFQPGDPLPPNQLPGVGFFPPNEVASPTLSTPYATQASLGYSRELTSWLGLNVELVTVRYHSLPFRFRANPLVDVDGDGVGDQRRFPQFGNFRLWYGNGEASYDGVNVSFNGRLSNKLELQAFYTYSEAEGNVLAGADEFRLTAGEHQAGLGSTRDQSADPLDPSCDRCFGPLNTDARNRLTLAAVYRLPKGFTLSGVYRYRSALPYTELAGTDLNGDGFFFDLPSDVPHVNSRRGESSSQFDLRLAKELGLWGSGTSLEVIVEVFNVFNEDNPSTFNFTRTSNSFGQPTTFSGDPLRGEQRLAQIGLRFRF